MGNAIEPEWDETSTSNEASQEHSHSTSRNRDVPGNTSSENKHAKSRNHVLLVPLSGSPKSFLDSTLISKVSAILLGILITH